MPPTMVIDSFDALLQATREESERQRLLLVFVKTVLPDDADYVQIERYNSGQGGGLVPVMCVDKAEDEVTDFDGLVAEAQQMGAAWDMVLAACMSGHNGHEPASDKIEKSLEDMIGTIRAGGSLAQFATFDRYGNAVQFE